MSKLVNRVIITSALFALAGCSSGFKDTLGLRRSAPDEFRVVSNAPLSVPPEFSLRPPMPGAKRPQDAELNQQAKDILLGEEAAAKHSGETKAESAFLSKANVQDADPEIKDVLTNEELDQASAEESKGFFSKAKEKLVKKDDPSVNAAKEKKRIEENSKEGKPVNEGVVPVVKETGWKRLKRIFGF